MFPSIIQYLIIRASGGQSSWMLTPVQNVQYSQFSWGVGIFEQDAPQQHNVTLVNALERSTHSMTKYPSQQPESPFINKDDSNKGFKSSLPVTPFIHQTAL